MARLEARPAYQKALSDPSMAARTTHRSASSRREVAGGVSQKSICSAARTTIVLCALLVGCAWVRLQPDAEGVRVIGLAEAAQCEKLGRTTASVLAKIGPFKRSRTKVRGELETVARNETIKMGGDAIAPTSEIEQGRQSFDVFRCRKTG